MFDRRERAVSYVRPTRYARLGVQSLNLRLHGRPPAHFLHIGKCAGTAVKTALLDSCDAGTYRLLLHTHGVRMVDLPFRDPFFFVVRDPVDRFVSGFRARQRLDAPRFRSSWTEAEALAFGRFPSASDLGLALAAGGVERAHAEEAMRAIEHVRTPYTYWFGAPDALRRRSRRILWIGLQDRLDDQMPALASALGLREISLPSESTAANRAAAQEELPEAARAALAQWYGLDYELLDLCRDLAVAR